MAVKKERQILKIPAVSKQAGKIAEEKTHKKEDWILVGIYADEGASGTGRKKRDGFLQIRVYENFSVNRY